MNRNLGREELTAWSQDVWDGLDRAVHDEMQRICIARRFLPLVPLDDALTVPADAMQASVPKARTATASALAVDEAAVTPLIEVWVEFALTRQQVEKEPELRTAVTLATRAANLLAQGEDLLVFRGDRDARTTPLFAKARVRTRAGPGPEGLSNVGALEDKDPKDGQVVEVPPSLDDSSRYGENTFSGVSQAYSRLQARGHYGPYALALQTTPYADAFAALRTTLIMPADRIKPLVEDRFYGTGSLPSLLGVLYSSGGNTGDLVIGRDAVTAFVQQDTDGMYRFRVFERFALRDKDPSGRVVLVFQPPKD
jgi:uncharacterized linocin/CFP29 family protein